RSVASPRSITSAPGGTDRPAPTALIVDPSMTTTAPVIVASPLPSKSRAALITVSWGWGVGLGVCAPAVDATRQAASINGRTLILLDLPGSATSYPRRRLEGRPQGPARIAHVRTRYSMRSSSTFARRAWVGIGLVLGSSNLNAADEPRTVRIDD